MTSPPTNLVKVYVDADVLFRAAMASHEYTAALVLLRMAEFTLLDLITAVYALDEATRALTAYLPQQVPILHQLISRTLRIVDDPSPASLVTHQTQAHWKDVINLAAAAEAQAHVLVTYNKRDYRLTTSRLRVMTPGEVITATRAAVYRELGMPSAS